MSDFFTAPETSTAAEATQIAFEGIHGAIGEISNYHRGIQEFRVDEPMMAESDSAEGHFEFFINGHRFEVTVKAMA